MRVRWMSGVLGLTLVLLIVPVAHAESSRPAAPKAAQAGGPDYAAFVKNGHKPVVTVLDKMTPSSMPFATEISPPIQEPNCAQAPATFNPATASTADLMKYGLPPQAKNESQASWLSKVSWMKHRVCTYYQTNAPHHAALSNYTVASNPTPESVGGGHAAQEIITDYWTGNIADQECGIGCPANNFDYTEADTDWYIPCITGLGALRTGAPSSAWVGLGGTGDSYRLNQAGSESDQQAISGNGWYDLWYESFETNDPNHQNFGPRQVNLGPSGSQDRCGEHVYARVYSGDCYELGDIDDQNFYTICTGSDAADNTAETIVERNGVNDGDGMPDFHSVTFRGVGVTIAGKGYFSVYQAWHDYTNDWWNNKWIATTGPWVYDGGDIPYYDYTINWESACGDLSQCP